jgi:hypothetical protein
MKMKEKIGLLAAVMGIMVGIAGEASATTFNFTDEYYINTSAKYNSTFGVTSGYNTAGIYQKTASGPTVVTQLTTHSTTSYQNVPGEFVENTNNTAALALNNFGVFFGLGNGSSVPSWYGPNNASSSPASIQYLTGTTGINASTGTFIGGTVTDFNLTSIALGSAPSTATSCTIEGLLNGTVVDSVYESLNTNGAFNTYTLNWNDIDTVELINLPLTGNVLLGTVNLSPVAPVPEPGTMMLLGVGMFGLAMYGKRRAGKKS